MNRPFPRGELSGGSQVTGLDELGLPRACRVIIRHPDATAQALETLAGTLGLHGTDYVASLTTWLDLSPVDVSKASALALVAEKLAVRRNDVLAVGDGRNDIDMLAWAGRGVAMGQAVQDVHDAADASTLGVAEDGLALELDRWF